MGNIKLNQAYKTMLSNIKRLIKRGHHPKNIKKDNPNLIDDIQFEINNFVETEICAKQS